MRGIQTLETADGEKQPKELVYGRRMSACLERLAPEASDLVRIRRPRTAHRTLDGAS